MALTKTMVHAKLRRCRRKHDGLCEQSITNCVGAGAKARWTVRVEASEETLNYAGTPAMSYQSVVDSSLHKNLNIGDDHLILYLKVLKKKNRKDLDYKDVTNNIIMNDLKKKLSKRRCKQIQWNARRTVLVLEDCTKIIKSTMDCASTKDCKMIIKNTMDCS